MAKEEKKENIKNLGTTVSKFETFFNKNSKVIYIVLIGIILIISGYLVYENFIKPPKVLEANVEIFHAQNYFEQDSFRLALDGDGTYPGFLDIIDNYGSTPSGNLANYYAGVCYMRLGEYETAIDYFNSYKSKEKMSSAQAAGNIGNAYLELDNKANALKYYLEAAEIASNDFLSPYYLLRAGETCELMGDNEQALKLYERINKEYFRSPEQNGIDKYIERVKTKINIKK